MCKVESLAVPGLTNMENSKRFGKLNSYTSWFRRYSSKRNRVVSKDKEEEKRRKLQYIVMWTGRKIPLKLFEHTIELNVDDIAF